jgi:hypothetical protein
MMKLIIIIVIVLIILGGGVLSGMAVLGMGGPLVGIIPQMDAPPKVELGLTTPMILPLDPMAIPVIENHEIAKQVNLEVKLLVERSKGPAISAVSPKLYSAVLEDLIVFMPIHLRDREEVDKEALKRRIMIVSERTIGKGLVKDVEFVAISYRNPT